MFSQAGAKLRDKLCCVKLWH